MEDEVKSLELKSRIIENSSWVSTHRSLGLLQECKEAAQETTARLVVHREKLEKTSQNLDTINASLIDSQKNIDKMKGVLTRVRSFFKPRRKDEEASTTQSIKEEKKRKNSINEAIRDTSRTTPDFTSVEKLTVVSEELNFIRRNSIEDAIDGNLEKIGESLNILKTMALGIGKEVVTQNSLLDEIRDKAEKADASIDNQNLQVRKLLK